MLRKRSWHKQFVTSTMSLPQFKQLQSEKQTSCYTAQPWFITEELGYDIRPTSRKPNQPPKWKTRLEHQITNWRNDICCLEHLKAGTLRNAKTKQWLIKKYRLETKTIAEVIEELKQRVLATAKKIERYEARIKQYRQNRQFNTNQRRFYQSLDDDNNTTEVPDK